MTMKRYVLLPALLIILSLSSLKAEDARVNPPLLLASPVLEFVDGIMGIGVDGQIYGMIMKLRLDFNKFLYGTKQPDGSFIGYYAYQGKKVMLSDLIQLENQGVNVSELLASAKQEFNQKVLPLIHIARGAKQHMVILIQEWAMKAKRNNSHLLVWAKTPEGQESQSLEKHITSFKLFEEFIADLVYYLETMLRSCPRAYKQFKDLVDQKLQQQHRP